METRDWVIVVGPLVGVLIGGAIATVTKVIELRHNRKAAKQDARVKKLEEISSALHALTIESVMWTQKRRLAVRELDIGRASDLVVGSFAAVELVGLQIRTYAPKLKAQVDELKVASTSLFEVGDDLSKEADNFVKGEGKGTDALRAKYVSQHRIFTKLCLELQYKITAEIQRVMDIKS